MTNKSALMVFMEFYKSTFTTQFGPIYVALTTWHNQFNRSFYHERILIMPTEGNYRTFPILNQNKGPVSRQLLNWRDVEDYTEQFHLEKLLEANQLVIETINQNSKFYGLDVPVSVADLELLNRQLYIDWRSPKHVDILRQIINISQFRNMRDYCQGMITIMRQLGMGNRESANFTRRVF